MFKITRIVLLFLSILSVETQAKPQLQKAKPVYAAIAVDAESGKILYQQNASLITPPASLTKLMTLLMLFDALEQGKLRLTDMIPVSKHAAAKQPCKLGLKPGSHISVQNTILALVTKSANDVAAVVGEFLGGTESAFANYMTQRARQFGMMNTTFKNASGWPAAGQLTTARDMAILGLVTQKHYKKYFHLFGVREFCYNSICHVNHNYRLLSQKHLKFDGIKTGFVNASGFNVIASHLADNGKRVIVVVMGGATPAWRDKRVVDIINRLKGAPHYIHTAKVTPSLAHSQSILVAKTPLVSLKNELTLTSAVQPSNVDERVNIPNSLQDSTKYSILLGYFGSQQRAETIAKEALAYSNFDDNKTISIKRIRIGGRYLYQASIDQLSKQQVDQVSSRLQNSNIRSVIVDQSS